MKEYPYKSGGFTLIELSIVLVTIGLIVAGIVGGRSLIHSVRLMGVVTDVNKYNTLFFTFEDYYGYRPGDLPNAKSYWPDDSRYVGFATSNGNGDHKIESSSEGYLVWQHLYLSDMLPKEYSGTATNNEAVLNVNVPESSLSGGGYFFGFDGSQILGSTVNGNFLGFGSIRTNDYLDNAIVSVPDAEKIDRKMDDGAPFTGKVLTRKGQDTAVACITGSGASATYVLSVADVACRMAFVLKEVN